MVSLYNDPGAQNKRNDKTTIGENVNYKQYKQACFDDSLTGAYAYYFLRRFTALSESADSDEPTPSFIFYCTQRKTQQYKTNNTSELGCHGCQFLHLSPFV
ncbi:Hypothetical predicted protein [Cloeon dipterum]|uniref:Uncharacterized protein n=1 Tax=Cloeon dipterum TaxID=197152 RepID=A0A8S1DJ89_9INSE|nr:Hypothetical predicted protein [Cloeon dipterum]